MVKASSLAFDFIHGLDDRKSADEIACSFRRFIEKFGFTYFCIGEIYPERAKRGAIWLTSSKDGWFKHWVGTGLPSVDPVIWHLKRRQRAVRWSTLKERNECPRLDMFDEAAEFGIRDGLGLAFKLGGAGGSAVAVGLGSERYSLPPAAEAPVHLASVYCSLKLARIDHRAEGLDASLSSRERECLSWVAAGKTDWETSRILNISQSTVQEHVKRALVKLNASTRAHAIAIALSTGQLTL